MSKRLDGNYELFMPCWRRTVSVGEGRKSRGVRCFELPISLGRPVTSTMVKSNNNTIGDINTPLEIIIM
jgi:hypothetical protein